MHIHVDIMKFVLSKTALIKKNAKKYIQATKTARYMFCPRVRKTFA